MGYLLISITPQDHDLDRDMDETSIAITHSRYPKAQGCFHRKDILRGRSGNKDSWQRVKRASYLI